MFRLLHKYLNTVINDSIFLIKTLYFYLQINPNSVVPPDFFPMTGTSYSYAPGSTHSNDSFQDVSILY